MKRKLKILFKERFFQFKIKLFLIFNIYASSDFLILFRKIYLFSDINFSRNISLLIFKFTYYVCFAFISLSIFFFIYLIIITYIKIHEMKFLFILGSTILIIPLALIYLNQFDIRIVTPIQTLLRKRGAEWQMCVFVQHYATPLFDLSLQPCLSLNHILAGNPSLCYIQLRNRVN